MSATILVVDDDPVQRRLLTAQIEHFGYSVVPAGNGEAALRHLATSDGDAVALIILDLVMPDLDGMAVLERLREIGRTTPVIVQTAHSGVDTVVNAMRAGAIDFVVKPLAPERLQVSIENALKLGALEGEIARIKRTVTGTLTFEDIVTRSPAMERAIHLGERAATSQIPILLEGEPGVGKEMFARAIHGAGMRRSKPFISINCTSIADTPGESILFGQEKGAFSHPGETHIAKFREAHDGTLFLNEVGELAADVQVRLLRALEDGEIDPIGAPGPIRVDCRLISATSGNLSDFVSAGLFRDELYYRLSALPIRIPPLRERREDIPELVRHFTARFAAEEGKRYIRGVDGAALRVLSLYRWPGNVHQLENAVFRAVVLADGPMISAREFPQIASHVESEAGVHDGRRPELFEPIEIAHSAASTQVVRRSTMAFDEAGDIRPLDEIEAEIIRMALERYQGRMTLVARKLGIGRSTLYRKVRELGIADSVPEAAAE